MPLYLFQNRANHWLLRLSFPGDLSFVYEFSELYVHNVIFLKRFALMSCKPCLSVMLSLFKLSTTLQDFIYVGNTACHIIRTQVLIKVLISMKVSESHLYRIWDNISREIHVYVEWTKNPWFCMCISIIFCNILIGWNWWNDILCHNPQH